MEGAVDRFATIAREIGVAKETDNDEIASKLFIGELDRLLEKLNVPTPMEYGIAQSDFIKAIPKMAADAMASGSPANTRRNVKIADMENIYLNLFKN